MTDERSRTVWERLEPLSRDDDMRGTLRGELADPLWLLARQRQFGEFAGEDAGSPVEVAVEYYQEEAAHVEVGSAVDTYDATTDPPLETLVEREPVAAESSEKYDDLRAAHGLDFLEPLVERIAGDPSAPNHALRAEAGMNFLDRLRRAVDEAPSRTELPTPTWFAEPLYLDRPSVADGPARRFADVFDGESDAEPSRGLDGHALYRALTLAVPGIADPSTNADWSAVADPVAFVFADGGRSIDKDLFTAPAEAFAEWYADLYDEPAGETDAWNPDRLEYEGAVSTGTGSTETTFEAEEYLGGRLDWYDFAASDRSLEAEREEDADADADTDADADADSGPETLSELPTKIRFRGMPASRLWELEDADVDLAAISAASDDLSRLFLLEFALVAGDDWFSLPIEAPVGSLTRLSSVTVTDTFDRTTDPVTATTNRSDAANWDMFTFDLPDQTAPGLFLPPVLGTSRSGEVVESVLYGRDEMANLVFGVENTVEGALGDPLDRTEFRAPTLTIEAVDRAPDDLSDPAAARAESVTLANDGDDVLEMSGWELRVEDPDAGTKTAVPIPDVTVPAEGSVSVVTGTGVDTDEAVHLDRSAPLLTPGEIVTVHKPTDSGMGLVALEPVAPASVSGLADYRLANEVPDHWFPYLPADDGLPQRFELALLLDADALSGTIDTIPEPMGRILDPDAGIYAEEISRTGTRVERSYQASQWLDGTAHVWSSYDVGPGTGEVSSNLRFDFLEDEEP